MDNNEIRRLGFINKGDGVMGKRLTYLEKETGLDKENVSWL